KLAIADAPSNNCDNKQAKRDNGFNRSNYVGSSLPIREIRASKAFLLVLAVSLLLAGSGSLCFHRRLFFVVHTRNRWQWLAGSLLPLVFSCAILSLFLAFLAGLLFGHHANPGKQPASLVARNAIRLRFNFQL